MIWSGLVWFGLVQFVLDLFGLVRFGFVWFGLVDCTLSRYKLWLTNGEPGDYFHYHFSADEFYILPILMGRLYWCYISGTQLM